MSLVNEGRTVCQEENILSPVVADKHLTQRYGHTRFSRARGHHKKAATVHLVEVVANAVNCPFLILSVGDVLLHILVGDGSTAARTVDDAEILCTMEAQYLPRRVAKAIYDESLETVGIVDDRADAVLTFQAVSIQFSLVLANDRVFAGSLGFDDRERPSVCTIEDIICITHILNGHSMNLDFSAGLVRKSNIIFAHQIPASITEHHIDEQTTGLKLRVVGNDRHGFLTLDGFLRNALDKCKVRGRNLVTRSN